MNKNNSNKHAPGNDRPAIKQNKQFKRELMDIFGRYGYLDRDKDHEVKIKITSGNIAWININSIETIK